MTSKLEQKVLELRERADELFLTLVNDGDFYRKLGTLLRQVQSGGDRQLLDFRSEVYRRICEVYPPEKALNYKEMVSPLPHQSNYRRQVLSYLTYLAFKHYMDPDNSHSFSGVQPCAYPWTFMNHRVEQWWRDDLEFMVDYKPLPDEVEYWKNQEKAQKDIDEGDMVPGGVVYDTTTGEATPFANLSQQIADHTTDAARYFNNVTSKLGEINMSTIDATKAVLSKTYIFGKDSDSVTVDDVFTHISRLETEAAKYDGIKNKPKAIKAKVDEINAQIAELVKFSDEKFK